MTDPRDELVPIAEAQERLGISETTLYRALANGQIPGGRRLGGKQVDGKWTGGCWIIARSVFDGWLIKGNDPDSQPDDAAQRQTFLKKFQLVEQVS